MPVIGTCALCKREEQELQLSHFLPAGVYRATRDPGEKNPNPILINDGGVRQDSKQVTAHLLCSECEERLNQNGERWFLSQCSRGDDFPLFTSLDRAAPVGLSANITVYRAGEIPEIDVSALTYFAASMFWRAAVHSWKLKGGAGTKPIDLGPYTEQLRRYLLGEEEFPQDCALWVSIPAKLTPLKALSLTPYGSRHSSYHMYKLLVLGVGFHLLVGARIGRTERAMCFVRGDGNPIYRTDLLEDGVLQDVNRKFKSNPLLLRGPKPGK
jgi:hypothetical protein